MEIRKYASQYCEPQNCALVDIVSAGALTRYSESEVSPCLPSSPNRGDNAKM